MVPIYYVVAPIFFYRPITNQSKITLKHGLTNVTLSTLPIQGLVKIYTILATKKYLSVFVLLCRIHENFLADALTNASAYWWGELNTAGALYYENGFAYANQSELEEIGEAIQVL